MIIFTQVATALAPVSVLSAGPSCWQRRALVQLDSSLRAMRMIGIGPSTNQFTESVDGATVNAARASRSSHEFNRMHMCTEPHRVTDSHDQISICAGVRRAGEHALG